MTAYPASVLTDALLAIVRALPLRAVVRIGRILGWLGWWLARRHRHLALRNLAIAFGDEHPPAWRRAVARESFMRFAANALVTAWMASHSDPELRRLFHLEGVDTHLRPSVAQGRGTINVLFHLGHWECPARAVASIDGIRFAAIYQPLRNPHLDRRVAEWRQRSGVALINRRHGFSEAVTHLRQGHAVGVLVDQHAGNQGMWVPFFGRLALTTPLPVLLARRTGASIVPVICTSRPSDGQGTDPSARWRVEFRAPIPTAGRTDGEILTTINTQLEEVIRQNPADWFWLHDRWKTPSPNFLTDAYRRGVYVPPGARLQPFRILVRGVNWLGDSILAIPALRAIRQGRPDGHLTLLVPPKLADLWRGQSFVDEVITSRREAADRSFDAAILFPNSFRSAYEAWRLGIPRRQGYAGYWRRAMLTAVCPESLRAGLHQHETSDFIGLARWCGARITNEIPSLDLPAGVPDGGPFPATPYVALHPGAAHGSAKRWLPERFVEVVQRFPALKWKVIGSAEEAERNARLVATMEPGAEDWTGRLSLRELAVFLHRAAALVCNDSGPMHLAAAVGTPVVAIFGSTEPRHTGPRGPGHRVLRQPVDCSPCYRKECPTDLRCMRAVTVDQAADALREILRGSPAGHP